MRRFPGCYLRNFERASGILLNCGIFAWIAFGSSSPVSAQTPDSLPPNGDLGILIAAALPDAPLPQANTGTAGSIQSEQPEVTLRSVPLNALKDQAAIWTSPVRLREKDFAWLVPLGLAVAVTITVDHQTLSTEVPNDTSFNHNNVLASDALTGMFVAAPVLLLGKGEIQHRARPRETGILGGEALVDGLIVDEGMKLIFLRERPAVDSAKGRFFQTSVGTDSSFPSTHSVLSWSSAAVMADEYPAWWQQIGIYSLATGVSITRVLGREHFPGDVLVGSAVGWMIGHYVHRRHQRVDPRNDEPSDWHPSAAQ